MEMKISPKNKGTHRRSNFAHTVKVRNFSSLNYLSRGVVFDFIIYYYRHIMRTHSVCVYKNLWLFFFFYNLQFTHSRCPITNRHLNHNKWWFCLVWVFIFILFFFYLKIAFLSRERNGSIDFKANRKIQIQFSVVESKVVVHINFYELSFILISHKSLFALKHTASDA